MGNGLNIFSIKNLIIFIFDQRHILRVGMCACVVCFKVYVLELTVTAFSRLTNLFIFDANVNVPCVNIKVLQITKKKKKEENVKIKIIFAEKRSSKALAKTLFVVGAIRQKKAYSTLQ